MDRWTNTPLDSRFWLCNKTWAELAATREKGLHVAVPSDLYVSFLIGAILLAARLLFQRWFSSVYLKLQGSSKQPKLPFESLHLERVYAANNNPSKDEFLKIAKQVDLEERQVQIWFRQRHKYTNPKLKKINETLWRFMFYLIMFGYGLITVWNEPWFHDTMECWTNHDEQEVTDKTFWYYQVELGFYYSLAVTASTDTKRKDYYIQLIHHAATIILMSYSWISNYVRVGTLVLLVHDCSDWLLEGAKLAKYFGKETVSTICFAAFTIAFFISRLVIYPYYILYSTLYEALEMNSLCYPYINFNILLLTLQAMHIYWFYLILMVIYKMVFLGKIEDSRSDSEHSDSE